MRRIPRDLLSRTAGCVSDEDRDERAIPGYLHGNPLVCWMAWPRIEVVAKFHREARNASKNNFGNALLDFGCGTEAMFDESSKVWVVEYR